MRYKIVHGTLDHLDVFTKRIEAFINDGWFLVGGVSSTLSERHSSFLLTQALAKATEPEAIDPWSAG